MAHKNDHLKWLEQLVANETVDADTKADCNRQIPICEKMSEIEHRYFECLADPTKTIADFDTALSEIEHGSPTE